MRVLIVKKTRIPKIKKPKTTNKIPVICNLRIFFLFLDKERVSILNFSFLDLFFFGLILFFLLSNPVVLNFTGKDLTGAPQLGHCKLLGDITSPQFLQRIKIT